MREDDGKIVKNAHLIGSIRRILKLLFHRIRPIFVFDGDTPHLKKNTTSRRRKLRERQEENYSKAAQKILVLQMKQAALKSAKEKSMATFNSRDPHGKYVDSFNPNNQPPPSSSSSSSSSSSATSHTVKEIKDDVEEEIVWEDGYSKLKVTKEDNDSDNAEDEFSWDIPEGSDLSVEVLSSLPSHIRKSVVQEARKKERQRKQANYIPVSKDPSLYSQTQLSNFLRSR